MLLVTRLVGRHGKGLLLHRHVTLELRMRWTLISIALIPASRIEKEKSP